MDERPIDVSVVMLGLDADARREIQDAMDAIASSGDTATPAGLVQMLREAIAVLLGRRDAWTHAAAENHAPMPPEDAEAKFGLAAHRARARFEHELVRAHAGEVARPKAPPLPPQPDVPGVVVVTLVVAARRVLRDVVDVRDRAALQLALDALAAIDPGDFVAMEVIWSPADPRERVPVETLEANHPELVRLPLETEGRA